GGTFAVRDYDAADRILAITNAHSSGSVFSIFQYAYDLNGNRTNQVEIHPAISADRENTDYRYDKLNRLIGVTSSGRTLTYHYAPNGNRITESGVDPLTGASVDRAFHYAELPGKSGSTFSGVNALTRIEDKLNPSASVDYEYDLNLNQIARDQG